MKTILNWQKEITEWAIHKGFNWTPKDIDTMLLRICSEIGEASEAARDDDMKMLGEEMADIFIRLANTAEVMGINLEQEIQKKMVKNRKRPTLHGRIRK